MVVAKDILKNFQDIGKDAFLTGLIASKSGNMSIRQDNNIIITATGSSLGRLSQLDLVKVGLDATEGQAVRSASTEVFLHQEIYKKSDALAIIHLHCPAAVALSISEREINPIDSEGMYYFSHIPVIHEPFQIGSKNVLKELSELLIDCKVAMVSGHGIFAKGQDLDEAFFWASSVEQSSKIIIQRRLLDKCREK